MAAYESKAAAEVKDYVIDWFEPLGEDTIDTSEWAATPSTLDLDSITPTITPMTTRIWLSGGIAGTRYAITNTVTTRGGRTFEQTFYCDVT